MAEIPEGMDRDEWVNHRLVMANKMQGVASALSRMYDYWLRFDLEWDFLAGDEYPFTRSLEDLISEVDFAADLIREHTDDLTDDLTTDDN